jgi:hypothetical protein
MFGSGRAHGADAPCSADLGAAAAASFGDDITDFVEFDPGLAIKATFRRSVSSGGVGDTDVLGAQQRTPLLDMSR